MRRLLLIALATALLATSPARAAEPPAYTPLGPGDTYLALGDSLAVGVEEPTNDDSLPGYPSLLYAQLRQSFPALRYENRGVSGETSQTFIDGGQLSSAVSFIQSERAAGRRVGLVTLDIGGNDMVGVFLGSNLTVTETFSLYRSNLETILDQLLAALTVNGQRNGDLLLMNYYNPYPDLTIVDTPPLIDLPPGQQPIVTNTEVPKFNQLIAEVAAARGLPVYNAFSAFGGRQASLLFVRYPYVFIPFSQANFDYHPRQAGHQLLASGFASISGYQLNRLYTPLISR